MEFGEDKSDSEVEKLGCRMGGGREVGIGGGDCEGAIDTEEFSVRFVLLIENKFRY